MVLAMTNGLLIQEEECNVRGCVSMLQEEDKAGEEEGSGYL